MPIIIDNLNSDDDSTIGTATEYNPDTDADLLDAINADADLDGDATISTNATEEGVDAAAEKPKKKRKAPALKPKGLTAKFFHRDLTGVGGRTGRLNKNVHPTNPDLSYQPVSDVYTPQSADHKGIKTRYILTHPTPLLFSVSPSATRFMSLPCVATIMSTTLIRNWLPGRTSTNSIFRSWTR